MTTFNKAWRFLKEDFDHFDPNDPNVMEKIEEKMKQLKFQYEQVKQMRAWKEQAPKLKYGNIQMEQRYPGEITTPAPDPNNPNALKPNPSPPDPFKTNFAPMCEVCKATPALQFSRMCGTCTNEKEAIERRNQQSRNNLQDRQDVSDSFVDYRT